MITRIFIAVFCIIFWAPIQGMAQQTVGIDWDVPDQQSNVKAELQHFSELGISYLQVHQSLDNDTWELISELGFTVYGKLPVNFPISQTFTEADSSFIQKMHRLLGHYNQQPSVQAVGVFSHGNWPNSSFQKAAGNFANEIKEETSKELYHLTAFDQNVSADSIFNFKLLSRAVVNTKQSDTIKAFLFQPEPIHKWNPAPVKKLLEYSRTIPNSVVFFNSSWLQQMEKEQSNFASTLQLYTTSADPAFPLPKKTVHPHYSNNLIVLMLLLAWIVLAVAYNYNPVYRRSLIRYYSGHNFYVNDVMKRHIRSMFAGTSILLQHAIAGGIVLYCAAHTGFSSLGLEALNYHYPVFYIFSDSPLSVFLSGFLLTLGIELIMVAWLWLANAKTTYISQIINLYPWSLQFNLVIATVVLVLHLAHSNSMAIYLAGILFIALFAGSFIITAFDTGRHIYSKRNWYFAGTIGVYIVIFAGLMGWLLISQQIQQVLELAASLP